MTDTPSRQSPLRAALLVGPICALVAMLADASLIAVYWQGWLATAIVGLLVATPIAWASAVWAIRRSEADARWRTARIWALAGGSIGAATGMIWLIILGEGWNFELLLGAALIGVGAALSMRALCRVRV